MTLSENAKQVFQEIRFAEKRRDDLIAHLDEIRDSRASPWYDQTEVANFDRENTAFAYGAMMKPQCSFGDPLARVSTKLQGLPAISGKAIEQGLWRNSVDGCLGEEIDDAVEDCFSHWGVLFSRLVQDPDAEEIDWMKEKGGGKRAKFRPWKPVAESIDIKVFGMDPTPKKLRRGVRYMFHPYVVDKEDLIKLATDDRAGLWDLDVINKLPVNSQLDKAGRKSEGTPDRNEVVLYHVWVSDSNRIYIVGATEIDGDGKTVKDAGFVKKPHDFDGPRCGPYTVYGFYKSRKSPYPLGPLSAVWGQHRSLNDEVAAQDWSSKNRKVVGLYDENDENVVAAIKAARDGDLIPIQNLSRDRVVALALGGADPVRQVVIEQKRERLERILGLSNSKRGVVTGGASATENAIADASISAIMGYVQKRVKARNVELLKLWAEWMFGNDSVAWPVTSEVGVELQKAGVPIQNMTVVGGQFDKVKFRDFEFDIDDDSTVYVSEPDRLARKTGLMGMYQQLAPVKRQFPEVDVKGLLKEVGVGSGNRDADRFYNDKLATALASALVGQPVESQGAEPPGEARLTAPGRGAKPGPQSPVVGNRGGGQPAPVPLAPAAKGAA